MNYCQSTFEASTLEARLSKPALSRPALSSPAPPKPGYGGCICLDENDNDAEEGED